MNDRKNKLLSWALLPCLVLLLASPVAAEGYGKGFIATDPFLDLAGEDDLVLEVNIKGVLLDILCSALGDQEPELSEMLCGLEAVQMVIVDLSKPAKQEQGLALMKGTLRDLDRKGWEKVAVVKEEDASLSVLIQATKKTVDGLVVLIHEKNDNQLIFVNISGLIDLAQIERLGKELEIPGLDQVPRER
jgi:hypothetical protein